MALAKEQIRQIISENNISSIADVYALLKDRRKDKGIRHIRPVAGLCLY